ncbi:MAG: hypothetical protein COA42_22550 [Alteromonadaceae bacterium]|nr:MAG: hypothetical protein COA42_22550 [Alteromonadaceae bacterium]
MHQLIYRPFEAPEVLSFSTQWQDFIQRASWQGQKPPLDYPALMKYGLQPCYWLEYVFQAYKGVSPSHNVILLDGVPDIAASRPEGALNHGRLPEG